MFSRTDVSLEKDGKQMALRKEEFYYDPHEERKSMDKAKSIRRRIAIEVSPELEARIIAAAEQQGMSISQYLEDLLGTAIPTQSALSSPRKPITQEWVEKLKQFQDQLRQEHGGKPFESSVELLHEVREERDRELDFLLRRPVTPAGVEKLMQIRNQILQEHGGQPFEKSIELLHQERAERERELNQQ
jgi:predicted HicB family RNase H-like nuclease